MEHLLNIDNVSLIYHTLTDETLAIESISMYADENEFISVVGPSGCGKTTLLSLISGVITPSSGKITLRGQPISEAKNKTGYMFQRDHLFEWRTVWQNIKLGPEIVGDKSPETTKYLDGLLSKYGLQDFKHKYPKHLSGGMRQRVALIRTLALRPELLLLDEPFGALDYQTKKVVIQDVNDIISREQKTSILVTHDIGEAASLSDRIIVLSHRPSVVKKVFTSKLRSIPLIEERKKTREYQELIDEIWKELI